MEETKLQSSRSFSVVMELIEKFANRLPHPFVMFFLLYLAAIVFSAIFSVTLSPVIHPATEQEIAVRSLLSWEGLDYLVTHTVSNFTGFRPLGVVIVLMLSLGLIQQTGLADAAIRRLLVGVSVKWMTPAVVMTSIVGNLVSDAAVFLIPPLAAMMFKTVGRNPLVGIIVSFVAVFAGFSANVFIAGTDLLMSGISTEVVQSVRPEHEVSVLANWFFMCVSVPLITCIITVITHKYAEPALQRFSHSGEDAAEPVTAELSDTEQRALRRTGIVALLFIIAVALLVLPESSGLRNADGGLLPSPFMRGLVPILMLFFTLCGITYGVSQGSIKQASDIPSLMGAAIRDMSGFIVIVFMVAQFIAVFNWSNLAIVGAVNGAQWLMAIEMPALLALLCFILFAAVLNLFIYSGSAQWALMAPVFLPMLMLMGLEPEAVQAAYRIADSSTNVISPINPYLPLILAFIHSYSPRFTIGNLLATALPYSLAILSGWIVLFFVWYALGLPFGIY
ncbi:AbgT family transporter (plasmid) [Photobacterium sp. DA100]|uniref:AbgT family transporter n=1 Tax=Photobacterium sp. DA100 TaxID=3027472 RepID=UPI00247A26B0|nr:AbgT family transporter [Photobacterium sp. DA100]WEM44906.1 AbgT family transporter [Photobacterium sp. DA100]